MRPRDGNAVTARSLLIGLVLGSFWVLWPFKDFDSGAEVAGRDGEEKGTRVELLHDRRHPCG